MDRAGHRCGLGFGRPPHESDRRLTSSSAACLAATFEPHPQSGVEARCGHVVELQIIGGQHT